MSITQFSLFVSVKIAKVNEKIMKTHTLAYITNPNFLEENKHLLRLYLVNYAV